MGPDGMPAPAPTNGANAIQAPDITKRTRNFRNTCWWRNINKTVEYYKSWKN